MSLIPYYLQYVSEICEGTRKAPAGIVLTEQEDLKKALQLQAEITKMGIPAFVRPAPKRTERRSRRRNMTTSTRLS